MPTKEERLARIAQLQSAMSLAPRRGAQDGGSRPIRVRTRNEHRNPILLNDLAGYGADDAAGAAAAALSRVTTDAKYLSNGARRCAEFLKNNAPASNWYQYLHLTGAGNLGHPVMPNKHLFCRASVRAMAGVGPIADEYSLVVKFYQYAGAVVVGDKEYVLDMRQIAVEDGWLDLEGFVPVPASASWARISVTRVAQNAVAQTIQFRVSNPQIVGNVDGDVPSYADGYQPGCKWMGTAGLSRTDGYAPPLSADRGDYLVGVNDLVGRDVMTGHVPPVSAEASVALQEELGCNFSRMPIDPEFLWPAEATSFNWGALDGYVHKLLDAGMKLTFFLGAGPSWMSPSVNDPLKGQLFHSYPPDADYRDRYCKMWDEIIRRYGRENFAFLEFWNEPNLAAFWTPSAGVSAVPYKALLQHVHGYFKARYPDLPIVAGSLSHKSVTQGDGQDYRGWIQAFIDAGGLAFCDGISIHPYHNLGLSGPDPTLVNGNTAYPWNAGFCTMIHECQKRIRAAGKPNFPIYITEVGFSENKMEHRYASDLSLAMGIAKRRGCKAFVVHTLVEQPSEAGAGFALVELPSLRRRLPFRYLRRDLATTPEAMRDHEAMHLQHSRFPGQVDDIALLAGWSPGRASNLGEDCWVYREGNRVKMGGTLFRSAVMAAAAENVFTLPDGWWPMNAQRKNTMGFGNLWASGITINELGVVTIYGVTGAGGTQAASFDGIEFVVSG